jgi:5-formyltetrahydrofolate cyclo-ligase
MGERRAGLPAAERAARSNAAAARLLALPELADLAGRTIAGYVAVKGELDPASALAQVAARGGRVALPRICAEAPRLRFHEIEAGAVPPAPTGPFGLCEPDAARPEVSMGRLDFVIVPGLAFDAQGGRLGFGGGYYDGALATARGAGRPALIGLAYDFQIVDACPVGPGDRPVDLVVTEARVLRRPPAPVVDPRGGPA